MQVFFWRPFLAFTLAALAPAHLLAAEPGQTPGGGGQSIVIVPFVNLTGESADEWIGAGIGEALAAGFPAGAAVLISPLRPDGGGVSNAEDSAASRAIEVARRLDSQYVVSGAYQRLGGTLRVTGRFVDLDTGSVVRSVKVDGPFTELFSLQDQVVAQLSGTIPRMAPTAPAAASVSAARGVGVVAVRSVGLGNTFGLIDGPPPPSPPEVVSRDAQGRATVRAVRLIEGIQVDGELDESVYQEVTAITDLVQLLPVAGAPATEKTEAWVMFDDTNVYVSARIWDSAPESQWVANEMRRDTSQLRQNDTFGVFFDTFYDRRNGYNFYTNPLGARADSQFTNEGNPNGDWNPVWDVRTGRFDGGWTAEMEIPFKTLRYRSGSPQVWGIQLRRAIRRKNEWVYLTRLPMSASGGRGGGSTGIFRVSSAATLVGLEPPVASRNIEVKPYAIGGITKDPLKNPGAASVRDGNIGLDVKYGITENLTADFTYNTDFAQVEVDEQQVNLTRFSLFFPEKREFFLEGRGVFDFARGGIGGSGGFGGGSAPTLFYSRRIGLQAGEVVPILGGGRVTGKIGQFSVGALSISTDDKAVFGTESTNFSVVRVKRDVLRRSAIGAIFTNRSVSSSGEGSSQTYGADATLAFHDSIQMLGYYAKTETPGLAGEDTSYQGRFGYGADRYGLQVDHLLVEDNFNPEVGFLRRDNFRRTFVEGRFSPRPESIGLVRQFRLVGSVDYILAADTSALETRLNSLQFQSEMENSDQIGLTINDSYELLLEPFTPPGAEFSVPAGGYGFNDIELSYRLGEQRRVNAGVSLQRGGYFNGNITTIAFRRGRVAVLPQMSVEPSVSFNWIDTPQGTFQTNLVVTRINYAFSPRMFFSGLVQYNSARDTIASNLRLRWEYSPGSELFVVYTEDRDTMMLRPDRHTQLRNRGFVIKFNRLFRF